MDRYRYIDALRAIAALAVIYFHVSMELTHQGLVSSGIEKNLYTVLTEYFDLGKIAVIVFFAISGFVVPFTLLKAQQKPIQSFVISRLFRLYPAYWLSIPFGVVFGYLIADKAITAKIISVNFTMLQQFAGIENIIGLYWTLQIELIFYVCCVGLFCIGWLQNSRKVFWVAVICVGLALILAVARGMMNVKFPIALPLSLSVMFWGVLWRKTLSEDDLEAKRLANIFAALFVVLIPVISLCGYNSNMGFGETWYKYTLTYITAIALFITFTRFIKLENPVLAYLGKISYSVYLFGPIGQIIVMTYFPKVMGSFSHGYIFITMALVILWSSLIYRFVEAPSINAGRSLIAKFAPKA